MGLRKSLSKMSVILRDIYHSAKILFKGLFKGFGNTLNIYL